MKKPQKEDNIDQATTNDAASSKTTGNTEINNIQPEVVKNL